MIFIRIKGHFDDKIFLTKFKDISQNSRTFHGFQGHCGNPVLDLIDYEICYMH